MEKNKKKLDRNKWLILFFLLVLVAAVGGYYYFTHSKEAVQVVAGEYLPNTKDAKKMTDKELKKAEQKVVDASKFNMVIKPEATFETADSEGSLYIKNPAQNAYPVNVVIQIDRTNEQVYSSGAIQPGYEISGAKLDKKLDAGVYPATATFNIYDSKTNKKRGQVQAAITIRVNQ